MSEAQQAQEALNEESGHDADGRVIAAATYLSTLATQLRASGLAGMTGADGVSAGIAEEARRLTAQVGGVSGSSGNSG